MAQYKTTFSEKLNPTLASGILNESITVVKPTGKRWEIVNSYFIEETSQICWIWTKGDRRTVVVEKPDAVDNTRIYSFSVDMCKRETWYTDAEYSLDAILSSGVAGTTFSFPHGSGNGTAILDLVHGKVTEENLLVAPTGTYHASVYVDGQLKEERECYETTGGDYKIDYVEGTLEFFSQQSGVITSTYYYVPEWAGPRFVAKPPPGKKWKIDYAELQASSDMVMTDTISYNVFLTHPIYGYIPAGPALEYKNFGNFLDFTFGSYPVVPAMGGPTRGTTQDTVIFRWNYLSPIELLSSLEMELISWTNHYRKYDGERCVLAIYGLEMDEE